MYSYVQSTTNYAATAAGSEPLRALMSCRLGLVSRLATIIYVECRHNDAFDPALGYAARTGVYSRKMTLRGCRQAIMHSRDDLGEGNSLDVSPVTSASFKS